MMGKQNSNFINRGMTFIDNHENNFYLAVLLIVTTVYYSFFITSVIPPQTGWWQYTAWRLNQGDLLYKDLFMYIPPYFVWFSSFLYTIFGNHFMLYTILGYIVTRICAWTLLYKIMVRFVKPCYAAIGIFTGACITSAYLVDQVYDYNPFIMMLVILQAYLLLRFYEKKDGLLLSLLMFLEGAICGILLMLKQNVGLAMPIIIIILLLWCIHKKGNKGYLKYTLQFVLGILIAVLPGVLYLYFTNTLDDCWRCITIAVQAKVNGDNFFFTVITNFVTKFDMILAIVLVVLCFCKTNKYKKYHNLFYILLVATTFLLTMRYYSNINGFISLARELPWMLHYGIYLCITIILFSIVGGIYVLKKKNVINKYGNKVIYLFLWSIIIICMFLCSILPNSVGNLIYNGLNFADFKNKIIYLSFYILLFLWIYTSYKIIIKKEENDVSFFLSYTVFMFFIGTSFVSAPLEELYSILIFSGLIGIALQRINASLSNQDISIKSIVLVTLCGAICLCCLVQKLYIPYEWHSWKSSSLLDKTNPIVSVEVKGLEGFRLPKTDAETYESIVNLINKNSSEDDVLYQFPNILLFNVLTERKSIYTAIPYFDVCPDSLAELSATTLKKEPPDLVLWGDISEDRWKTHELLFRNGNRSGQRSIQNYYIKNVTKKYKLLGSFDNNKGEPILLWKQKK